jgi:hypothetical protein
MRVIQNSEGGTVNSMTIQEFVDKPPSADTVDMCVRIEQALKGTPMLQSFIQTGRDPEAVATGFAVALVLVTEKGMPDLDALVALDDCCEYQQGG